MFSIYHNFIYGQIAFSISDTDTTIESSGLVGIKTLEPDEYSPVVLDPLSTNGPPEVVYVTEHTEGQATAVVERGKEGTNARSHDFGTQFVHNLTAESLNTLTRIELGTEGVVPVLSETDRDNISDPEDGNVIYNTDVQRLETYDGSEWRQYLQEADGDARYTLQVGGTIRGYVEPSDDPGASGTVTLDLSAHNVYDITPTGTIDFAFSGLPSAGDSASATIIVRNDSHAITWPAGTRFPDGEAPELDGETWLVVVAVGSQVTVFESASAVA